MTGAGTGLTSMLGKLGITMSAAFAMRSIIRNTAAGQRALAQLRAGLKSTGDGSGQTMESLVALSNEMQRTTTFADDLVQSASAVMLSFTQISDDVFPRAIRAAADVATRMGTDLQSAVVQLAKALNDPITNLSAMSRAGIQFTKDQKAMIKALWEGGKQAEAQAIILKELETQYGGSAEAARDTLGGALTNLGNAWSDLLEAFGQGISPSVVATVNLLADAFERAAKNIADMIDNWQNLRRDLNRALEIEYRKLSGDDWQERMKEQMRVTLEGERKITEVVKTEEEKRSKFREMGQSRQLSIIGNAFNSVASLIGTGSKKAFEAQKKWAVGAAVMNTASAVTLALATYPPPWGAIAAGSAFLNGMAQVAAIRNTTYEGGGAPGGMSGGGGPPDTGGGGGGGGGGGERPIQEIVFNITGGGTITTEQLREVAERLSEEADDGMRMRVRT
jgi:hypothetical protein